MRDPLAPSTAQPGQNHSDALARVDEIRTVIAATEAALQLGGGPPHLERMARVFVDAAVLLRGAPYVQERVAG